MSFWTATVIVMGMIFGTGFTALLFDQLQKRRKRAPADDRERIAMLEKRVELQEQQILDLIENQRYTQRLIEDQHEDKNKNDELLP